MKSKNKYSVLLAKLQNQSEKIAKKQEEVAFGVVSGSIVSILLAFYCLSNNKLIFLSFCFIIFAAVGIYQTLIRAPFFRLKEQFKGTLIGKFMSAYYPDISYRYGMRGGRASDIVRQSNLIIGTEFKEEDVIVGTMEGIHFYLSQIYSSDYYKSSFQGGSKSKRGTQNQGAFRGMLMEIIIPDANFPESTIVSSAGFFRKNFLGFKIHEKFNFAYVSDDEELLAEQTANFLPFIAYLKAKHDDIKIQFKGNKIVLMLSTETDFLDEPDLQMGADFSDPKYYNGISNHLSSMFFILDSLIGKETPLELEEKLELRVKNKEIRS